MKTLTYLVSRWLTILYLLDVVRSMLGWGGLFGRQMRRLEDKARMETELGALGAQLERAKLIQTARARRMGMEIVRGGAPAAAADAAAVASVPGDTEATVVQRTLVFDAESSRQRDPCRGRGGQDKGPLTPELDLSQTRAEVGRTAGEGRS